MRPTVLVTRRWPDAVIAALRERYEVTTNDIDRPLSPEALREAMLCHDILCPTITDRIDAGMIEQPGRRVRIIGNFGAGFEHIDIAAARRAGVVVTNTPNVLTQATAELCILLMLMTARRAGEGERQLRGGQWPGWHPTHLMGTSLAGKRLGLVGYGRIAREVARMAANLWDMKIAYHARHRVEPAPGLPGAEFCASLAELVEQSDVVSIQCPGGAATHHLIDVDMIARMKPTAFLINTARGTVVDERALADALAAGRIAGAGLDVYEREPKVEAALFGLENVVLLPHLGSATVETREAMGFRVLANLDAFLAGQEPPDRVA